MSDNFWNRNQNASDSNGRRRRIVFALYVTNALGNDGPRRRGRGRGRGRMPNMPPQRREVDLPKWRIRTDDAHIIVDQEKMYTISYIMKFRMRLRLRLNLLFIL
jgi:hypothetical protein